MVTASGWWWCSQAHLLALLQGWGVPWVSRGPLCACFHGLELLMILCVIKAVIFSQFIVWDE